VVTGIPRFDNIWNRTFDNSAFRRQFGLARDKSVVSLLTDAQVEHRLWTVGRRRDFISKLLSACQEIPEVQFVIKVHPYEDPTDYQQAVKKLGLEIPVSKEIPLYDLINASDAVMTGISTTGMETLIFNKPLLILNLYRQPEYIPYVSQGVALGIHDAGDIPECIRAALDDQPTKDRLASNRAGFLHQHLYLQDGKASERVADLIRQMVKRPFEPPQN
jgi:CDP-glycerol glycerophosphotransferase (TagB/SpsB family)